MKVMHLVPGTPEWEAHRFSHFNASELAAAMGLSKKMSRSQLLHLKATGNEREFSAYVREVILASGHRAEAIAREQVAIEIGEDLFPIIGVSDDDPRLSASFDGVNLDEDVSFECKVWNQKLVEQVRAGELREEDFPEHIYQMEQQLLINTKSDSIRFVVAKEDGSDKVEMRYRSVPERRAKILPTWNQFEADMRAYVAPIVKPAVVATPVETLPAIVCTVNRADMTVTHNLVEYRAAVDIIAERARLPMVTDQDFADRKAVCKRLRDAETALKAEAERLIGQMADIAATHRGLKDLAEVVCKLAIDGENLVDAEVKNRKQAIVDAGAAALTAHLAILKARFAGRVAMPTITGNFASVTKGLRTISSVQNAVDTELARLKIEANAVADGMTANLASLDIIAPEHGFLFADLNQIITKPNADYCALVKVRIDEHKAKEEARLAAERERIAREEREKAEREARAMVAAEEAARRDEERLAQLAQQAAKQPAQAAPAVSLDTVLAEVAPAPVAAALTAPQATSAPAAIPANQPAMHTYAALRKPADIEPAPSLGDMANTLARSYDVDYFTALRWLQTINPAELADALKTATTEAQEA